MPDDFRNAGEVQSPDAGAGRLAEQIRGFMQKHGLNLPRMAAHAGISRNTLKPIVAGTRQPRHAQRVALLAAIAKEPPPKPEPRHADLVREYWGQESSEAIGRRAKVSGSRIRAIAAAIGLTGDQAAA